MFSAVTKDVRTGDNGSKQTHRVVSRLTPNNESLAKVKMSIELNASSMKHNECTRKQRLK